MLNLIFMWFLRITWHILLTVKTETHHQRSYKLGKNDWASGVLFINMWLLKMVIGSFYLCLTLFLSTCKVELWSSRVCSVRAAFVLSLKCFIASFYLIAFLLYVWINLTVQHQLTDHLSNLNCSERSESTVLWYQTWVLVRIFLHFNTPEKPVHVLWHK